MLGTPQHAVKPHPRAIDDIGERNRSARWRSARARIHLGLHEQADRRDAGRTGASHIVATRLGDAADRQHRHLGRGNDRAQPLETEERLRRRLRSCREDGAGDQIVRAGWRRRAS